MTKELSVYSQIIEGTSECLAVVKREIGMKTACMPFAVKMIGAMRTLDIKTEQEQLDAANTLLAGLQTLMQGGICAEDYDKIDFVKRGKLIVPSARVEAFLRAAARKGYRITDTIVAVPKEDKETTFFKENFYNGDIVYTLEDRRNNTDREVTAQRLIDGYFAKFMCRLDIHEAASGKRVAMSVCEMSNAEVLEVSSTSEQGIYKSRWEKYKDQWGRERKRKVITDELNSGAFWCKWTGEMVNKTIIRRALKRVREVLPELKETIYAFDRDEYVEQTETQQEPIVLDIPLEQPENVDLRKLTEEQTEECRELLEMWKANPILAENKFAEIKAAIANGEDKQQLINREYASIAALQKSKTKWSEIGGLFQ